MGNVILPLILVSVAAMFGLLAFTPRALAYSRLQELSGNKTLIHAINASASTLGYTPPAGSGWVNDLALNAVFIVGFSYIISAVYVAGEVKKVKRNMPIAMIGTLLITLVIFAGSTLLAYNTFGYGFLSNLYNLSIVNAKSPFTVVPYLDFLTAAISGNVWLGSFIIIMAAIQLLWYQSNAAFVGGRLLLSYSFDRIMPGFLGDVSSRFHLPVKATLVSLIIGLLAGFVFVLPSTAAVAFLMSSAASAILLIFPICVVGIALFDYRRNHSTEFKTSVLAGSWLGGWVYYVAGAVTVLYSLVMFYEYVTVPGLFGFAGQEGLELIFAPIVILFAIYYVSKGINARRGIRFDAIFRQIPPE